MVRYLRIAVTALSLTACVLLIALWVRSYWWADLLAGNPFGRHPFSITSAYGKALFRAYDVPVPWTWEIDSYDANDSDVDSWDEMFGGRILSIVRFGELGWGVIVPYWSLALLSAVIAAVPWIVTRFSLRTLLIATTLVAVGLGVIIWASR